jgi:predicted TIM-barrel fold metal-dependent hydrolase
VRGADLNRTPEKNSKLHHLRRFYYDTALSANPIQLQALKALVGPTQIVFGSDFPFMSIRDAVEALQECELSEEELRDIDRGNALRFLPAQKSP